MGNYPHCQLSGATATDTIDPHDTNIANGGSLEDLTKEEAIIVRYGRELMDDHQVSQETFDAALAKFGEANTIVLGALMGYYSFISCTLFGTDMRPAEGSPVLPERA